MAFSFEVRTVARWESLNRSSEFRTVFDQGKSRAGRGVVVFAWQSGSGAPRVGFVVSRKLGKAVVRNRVRRRLRAALRAVPGEIAPGWWLVVMPRTGAGDMPFSELVRQLQSALINHRALQRS